MKNDTYSPCVRLWDANLAIFHFVMVVLNVLARLNRTTPYLYVLAKSYCCLDQDVFLVGEFHYISDGQRINCIIGWPSNRHCFINCTTSCMIPLYTLIQSIN